MWWKASCFYNEQVSKVAFPRSFDTTDKSEWPLQQQCPTELSEMMEIFCICEPDVVATRHIIDDLLKYG